MAIKPGTNHFYLALALGAALVATDVQAQWTYSSPTSVGDCSPLSANLAGSFRVVPVVSRTRFPKTTAGPDSIPARVMKFDMDTLGGGKIDIYFTEKFGKVRRYRGNYDGSDSSLSTVGVIPVNRSFQEDGLWSLVLDPNFKTNGWLYALYATSPNLTETSDGSATVGWRLSRFTVDATTKTFVTGSQVDVLHIPAGTGRRWHTGSGMRFDNAGNLYVGLGDNEGLMMTSGNTADLRGGIIRIKPTADGKYTIPAGNFGEYWAQKFTAAGRTALAAQYRDTSKVRPEIYVKGSRNPYSYGIDPHRPGLVAWSECGPDAQRAEEHNISSTPAFSGWPFWAGNAVRQAARAGDYNEPGDLPDSLWNTYNPTTMVVNNPVNTWPGSGSIVRKGVDSLPPMHVPAYAHTNSSCSQGGPILRYDGRINNPLKMPPHLDNVWLFTDFSSGTYWAYKIDTATGTAVGTNGGTTVGTPTTVFPASSYPRGSGSIGPALGNSIEMKQGPDGALYVTNWGAGCCDGNGGGQSAFSGIARVEYTGTCQDPGLKPTAIASRIFKAQDVAWLKVSVRSFSVLTQGKHEAAILDIKGRVLHSFTGTGNQTYSIPQLGAGNLHILRVKTPEGMAIRSFSSF